MCRAVRVGHTVVLGIQIMLGEDVEPGIERPRRLQVISEFEAQGGDLGSTQVLASG